MQQVDDSRRQVVPRWRPFRVAAQLRLLDSPGTSPSLEPAPGELEELVEDWRRHRSPFHAANLVDAAVVLNRPEIAADAAQFLLSEGRGGLIETDLARFVLGDGGETPLATTPPDLSRQERYRRIAEARRSLRQQPWNPILLVDLAREYSALGQLQSAERALVRAVMLAPDNRFVLRAASRFLLHAGRPDDAHRVLRRAPSTPRDPWLLAAEIVAADAGKRSSRWMKVARRMINDGGFEPRHTTELASAVGTVEHSHGNRPQVRRLFEHALIEPTENTVAQAAWISRHMPAFEVPEDSFSVPRAFEARAWESAVEKRYREAVDLSWEWLRDEPFATRAASFGSAVASIALGDFEAGKALASAARLANPDDPRLILQLIYCVASQGDPDEAERLLTEDLPVAIRRHPGRLPENDHKIFEVADRGLIAYRRGQVQEGRLHYERAMTLAREAGSPTLEAGALLNFLREEALANPGSAIPWESASALLKAFPASVRPFYESFLERTRLFHRTGGFAQPPGR